MSGGRCHAADRPPALRSPPYTKKGNLMRDRSPMLNVAEVAIRVGVSQKTIRRSIDAGELHCYRIGRRILRRRR